MSLLTLVGLFIGLVVVLALLIFLFFVKPKKKRKIVSEKKKIKHKSDFKSLQEYVDIIKDKRSSSKDLEEAVNGILKYHGTIHSKLGSRTHPDFDIYLKALFQICRHPNTSKDIILKFNRALEKQNPSYKREINDAIMQGLNSRS